MSQQKSKKTLINWDLVTINPNNKNWDWKDLFCFWGVNIQSVIGFSLITSLYLIYNLNTFVVFVGSILGSLLIYFFSNLIGKPSQKFGLPFVVLLRSSLGFKGAKYFGLIRCLVGTFLFGIQTYFLSKIFTYLIRIFIFKFDPSLLDNDILLVFLLGMNIIDWSSIVIAIIFQGFLFSFGMNFNKKIINYSMIIVYLGIILFFFSVLLSDVKFTTKAFLNILDLGNFVDKSNIEPILTVTGTVFAYFSIVILSFGDFSRYVKNESELKKGNLSLILNLIIFSFFALFIVIGSDALLKQNPQNLDQIFTNPTDIIGKFDNIQVTVIVLFFIIIASASTNLIANFIPSQYSMINFQPDKFNIKTASYTIGFFGLLIGILWPTILSQIGILSFVDTFGSFFGPISGVMIVDYYMINQSSVNVKDIHISSPKSSFYFTRGWHLKAVYSVIIGFIFASSTIWNSNLMFLQSYAWIIGLVSAGFVYYLLGKK